VHSSYASAAASAASLTSDSLINACDGTQVLCAATAEVSNGLITGLTGLQVWDD
jgi:hypothetical protein